MHIDKEFATVNRRSWLARWLTVERWNRIREDQSDARMREAFGILSRRPGYERLTLHRATKRGVAYTGFALDQFKARTERDGAVLAILATYRVGQSGDRVFDRLHDLAAARGIPVISQRAWIERRGEDVRDARWTHDAHWTPTGHRWAAEALLEWLTRNQDVCHQAAATP